MDAVEARRACLPPALPRPVGPLARL